MSDVFAGKLGTAAALDCITSALPPVAAATRASKPSLSVAVMSAPLAISCSTTFNRVRGEHAGSYAGAKA